MPLRYRECHTGAAYVTAGRRHERRSSGTARGMGTHGAAMHRSAQADAPEWRQLAPCADTRNRCNEPVGVGMEHGRPTALNRCLTEIVTPGGTAKPAAGMRPPHAPTVQGMSHRRGDMLPPVAAMNADHQARRRGMGTHDAGQSGHARPGCRAMRSRARAMQGNGHGDGTGWASPPIVVGSSVILCVHWSGKINPLTDGKSQKIAIILSR